MNGQMLPIDPARINARLFWSKVQRTDTCWLWTGFLTREGYGRYTGIVAHRVSYVLSGMILEEDLVLDHLCRVRNCVRPDHLEPVTNAENIRRGNGGRPPAEVCIHGHGDNWYIRKDGTGKLCRTCVVNRSREYRARKKKEQQR